jgi:hypothetical protein
VPIALNTYAEAGTLMLEAWDVVIVATGGTPAAPAVPGAHLVHDTWDLLAGATRIQGHVAVYDDHGGNQALDAAEALARGGATVEIITPERRVGCDRQPERTRGDARRCGSAARSEDHRGRHEKGREPTATWSSSTGGHHAPACTFVGVSDGT